MVFNYNNLDFIFYLIITRVINIFNYKTCDFFCLAIINLKKY